MWEFGKDEESERSSSVRRESEREEREVCERAKESCQVKEGVIVGSHERCRKKSEGECREKKGLRRESNPGHLHPKQILYHLTTKPSSHSVSVSVMSSSVNCV